jgi:hypothetical protein
LKNLKLLGMAKALEDQLQMPDIGELSIMTPKFRTTGRESFFG